MNLLTIGVIVILIGVAIAIIGALIQSYTGQKSEGNVKYSMVGFIGPIPFGFGNDKQLMTTTLIIGIVFILVLMFLFRGMR